MNKTIPTSDSKNRPLVSVITVTYNAEKLLEQTIRSVMEQSYPNVEHIIVDGGSADRTVSIIRENEASISKWISESDQGIYDAMNKGMALATGQYLNFLNAGDCYCCPDTVSLVMTHGQNADLVYGNFFVVDNQGVVLSNNRAKPFTYEYLRKYQVGVLNHQTVFINREKAPRYSGKYRVKGELNWYFDILEQGGPALTWRRLDFPIVNFLSGGYSDRIYWEQMSEFLKVMYRRTAWPGVLYALRNTLYIIGIRARARMLKRRQMMTS